MAEQHPITPPAELLKQWEDDWFEEREHADVLLIQAFQAGAEQARAALEAQPEPVGPTDKELRQVLLDCGYHPENRHLTSLARAILARWGRPAIEPIPVSERLPGPEDCAPWPDEPDATPWAWAAKEVAGGWEWAQISMSGIGTETFKRIIAGGGWTHWAPHWAFPTPRSEEIFE